MSEEMVLSKAEFNAIRDRTRQAWQQEYEDPHPGRSSRYSTSYTAAYHQKEWDPKQTTRPTSPTRMNNPHPPKKFLSTKVRAPRIPAYGAAAEPKSNEDINLTIEPLGHVKPLVNDYEKPFGTERFVYEKHPAACKEAQQGGSGSSSLCSTPENRQVAGMEVKRHPNKQSPPQSNETDAGDAHMGNFRPAGSLDQFLPFGFSAESDQERQKQIRIHPRVLRLEYIHHPEWIP